MIKTRHKLTVIAVLAGSTGCGNGDSASLPGGNSARDLNETRIATAKDAMNDRIVLEVYSDYI